jgi:hypothetical protein
MKRHVINRRLTNARSYSSNHLPVYVSELQDHIPITPKVRNQNFTRKDL